MNDQYPYDPYAQQPEIIGYDAYGQPVYQQQYDPYAQQQDRHQQPQQGYGYDPYAQQPSYDPYAQQAPQQQPYQPQGQPQPEQYGSEQYGYGYDPGQQQAAVDTTAQWIPRQVPAPEPPPVAEPAPPAPAAEGSVPEQRRPAPDYATEQFAFVEDPDEDSEDVIDWLKFTESRTERREEARRKGRSRVVSLVVVLALVVAGGVGYLWYAGKLPGFSASDDTANTATGPQKRDVIAVHLHNTKGGTSTVLLVDNVTTKQGTTVLLPNALSVANDDGTTTTLGKSVDEDGSSGTREAIGTVLGTRIGGSWRLDTPYLENLVELVGNIAIDTDTDVPDTKKGASPLVKQGKEQTLSGSMAVAYATHRGPGEAEAKQLQRFGQVMNGVLKKISDDPRAATTTVRTLAQILDPSLPEKALGASLAKLAEHAKGGDYKTAELPVQPDGKLSEAAADSVVKDVLGGSVRSPEQGAAARVGVKNATADPDAAETARIALVNGGYAFVDGGKADAATSSQVSYGDAAQKPRAEEVAKTLGLPTSAVRKGKAAANADVTVVLGQDFKAE
ncbi:LCP family protein [Streptomyces sp. H27-C3]|uniref:LCP family protein n=1 Tax=Streptomyces sp. H27-C3 TaxID=3046305 RepID=UPI0024BB1945|nr:LCP family protein [Streptomyces sp. H27-C3]MDJ0466824.1 LCP family protein [Streptomyces sp. H27-C3]